MTTKITSGDCSLAVSSINYFMQSIENYTDYPSYEFKLQRISEVEAVRQKFLSLRTELKQQEDNQ